MERFLIAQNIQHYRLLLKTTQDETRRKILQKLLKQEEAKEAQQISAPKQEHPAA